MPDDTVISAPQAPADDAAAGEAGKLRRIAILAADVQAGDALWHAIAARVRNKDRLALSRTPREEAEWWTLKKGQRRAVCRMWSHQLGHELRLEVSRELVASKVCKTEKDMLDCHEFWFARLLAEGWKK